MNRLQATVLVCATLAALPFTASVRATDNCGDIDVDHGPALRVITEECRAQQVDSSICARIAQSAVRRLEAM